MGNILTVGFVCEGSTDHRFLENIIKRTFEDAALFCEGLIDVYDPVVIKTSGHNSFSSGLLASAQEAFKIGMNVLCVHSDADDEDITSVMQFKFEPGINELEAMGDEFCKNVVPIIPVHMSEAWMLADIEIFKDEISTTKSDQDLGLNRDPESIADPKSLIKEALRVAQQDLPKRRPRIGIADLYRPLGQRLTLESLMRFASYRNFKEEVDRALVKLNYRSSQ